MGQPAVVMGDAITGACPIHQIPAATPSGFAPAPGLPFQSPLNMGLTPTVLIGGKPAAVQNSSGVNTAHPPLFASDPAFLVPSAQLGRVVVGSATVLFEGKGAAYTGCAVVHCTPPTPGQVVGSGATVMIGA